MAKSKDGSSTYEAMFLLGAAAASELENMQKFIRTIIERHGGKILVLKKWDERKLYYEVRGQKRGLYIISYFEAPGNGVSGIVRDVELSDQILRVLVTKADHLNADEMAAVEPQPIQPREERNTWDRPAWEEPMGSGGPRRDRPPRGPRSEESPEAAVGKE